MNTDITDEIKGVVSSLPTWGLISVALSILLILGYCIYRARSFDFLLDRAWIFFGGNKEFKDPIMNQEWDSVKDVELYRYRYGFLADSIEDVDNTRAWINKNNININQLRRISNLFDFKKFEVKGAPFLLEKTLLLVVFSLLLSFTYLSIVSAFTADPYFEVVDTDAKFKFDGDKIVLNNKVLKRQDCAKLKNIAYPDSDLEKDLFNKYISCSIFTEDGKKLYKNTRNDQKIIGLIGAGLFLIIFPIIIRKYMNYELAIKIKMTLEKTKEVK
ncbi:DUF6216 family protein [Comamonas sp. CMM02]|uniref:DUF6216 family protein n=1 Tax=Comamonas sp. CMM02 TaxID=2769307 RepID=UPI00177EB51C|nr:DUF6216 family protein [Comamonas sp. CMM02]MBD9400827.1 hypothetical protein [Comamonas sp. CMM02]